jgi:hypothetical protein
MREAFVFGQVHRDAIHFWKSAEITARGASEHCSDIIGNLWLFLRQVIQHTTDCRLPTVIVRNGVMSDLINPGFQARFIAKGRAGLQCFQQRFLGQIISDHGIANSAPEKLSQRLGHVDNRRIESFTVHRFHFKTIQGQIAFNCRLDRQSGVTKLTRNSQPPVQVAGKQPFELAINPSLLSCQIFYPLVRTRFSVPAAAKTAITTFRRTTRMSDGVLYCNEAPGTLDTLENSCLYLASPETSFILASSRTSNMKTSSGTSHSHLIPCSLAGLNPNRG